MAAKYNYRNTAFVHEYFYGDQRGNAEQAARLAGFAHTTARKKSFSWVGDNRQQSTNKVLWDMVDKERRKIAAEYGITQQELMEGYKRDVSFDPRKLFKEDGTAIYNLQELDDDTALALSGFEIDEKVLKTVGTGDAEVQVVQRKVKFKFPDKKGNRDSMAKIKGLFIDKKELTGPDGGPLKITIVDYSNLENEHS